MTIPKIQVIFSAGELPRFSPFYADLWRQYDRMKAANPQTPRPEWRVGVDICYNINSALRSLQPDVEAVWIIGDDHTFDPTTVERLWARNVPVVAPFCLKRSAPHETVMYGPAGETLKPEPFESGLKEVAAVGSAGMLIRRSVLDLIGDPWFVVPGGGAEHQSEDLIFCHRLQEKGIPIYVDLDVPIGHIVPVEVWPLQVPGKGWAVQYRIKVHQEIMGPDPV